jgi:hypothetical protein
MTTQRNLNISFREKDIDLLQQLKTISDEKFITTSRLVIDLIRKGMLYDNEKTTVKSNK